MKHSSTTTRYMKANVTFLAGVLYAYTLTAQSPAIITDIDGNQYTTVQIGKQTWMAENLRTTRLRDGSLLPRVEGDMAWYTVMAPAYCWYENNVELGDAYGALYNWYAVGTNKLCPSGWHVPGHGEWTELAGQLKAVNTMGTDIQMNGELKSTRTVPAGHPRWDLPNEGASNRSGFSAMPGGQRNFAGTFMDLGRLGIWWTSSGANSPEYFAWYRGLRAGSPGMFMTSGHIRNGFSVRCVRD